MSIPVRWLRGAMPVAMRPVLKHAAHGWRGLRVSRPLIDDVHVFHSRKEA